MRLLRLDQIRARFGMLRRVEAVPHRVDATPHSVARFDDGEVGAVRLELPRRRQSREVYGAIGKTLTRARLCELMITVSSNFASNLLSRAIFSR